MLAHIHINLILVLLDGVKNNNFVQVNDYIKYFKYNKFTPLV